MFGSYHRHWPWIAGTVCLTAVITALTWWPQPSATHFGAGPASQGWVRVHSVAGLTLFAAFVILGWEVRGIRRAHDAAHKANSAKAEFLANMSHEIRTPLHGISGVAELLAKTQLDAEQRSLVGLIQGSCESLTAIVDDILHFSVIEGGGLEVQDVEFDLRELVESSAQLLSSRALTKGLKLEVSIAGSLPRRAKGDPVQLRRVLLNLLSNAVKFTEQGKVRLEVLPGGDPEERRAVLFRVIDTGIGMEPEVLGRLFTPFSQGNSGPARHYGGTGLGLAISGRLLSLMGGSIGVESRPGAGSTFWFLIPIGRAEGPSSEAAEDFTGHAPAEVAGPLLPDAPATNGRVLIVDDNPVNQIVALRAIRGLGYAAEVVPGGTEALEAFGRDHFDLILMDCQMPGMDGYEAALEIRRRCADTGSGRGHIPIVAMTANGVEGDYERCRAAGMDDYLTKPVRMADLEGALRRWIPHRSASAASAC